MTDNAPAMNSILIAICTCMRQDLLRQCLQSLCDMRIPPGVTCEVLVVDNDSARSAEPVYQAFYPHPSLAFHYHCEERRGIPCARNAAIQIAIEKQVDGLIFIDDDEWVETQWLTELFDYSRQHQHTAIISGFVVEHLPEDTPAYIAQQFGRKRHPSGTTLYTCATNNVLIPKHVYTDPGLRFDESAPLAGGTDTLFFQQASDAGKTIYRCAEAVVHEAIPAARTSLGWLSKRKYRVGITDAVKKIKQNRNTTGMAIRALVMVLVECIKATVALLLLSPYYATKFWLRACKQSGVIAGVFGAKIDSYTTIDK